jgi:hypothetical protein
MPITTLNDVRIFWEQNGDSGPPLVLVHGSWGDRHQLGCRRAWTGAHLPRVHLRPARSESEPTPGGAGEVVVASVIDILKVGGATRCRLAARVLGAIGTLAARQALENALKTESDPGVKRAIGDAAVHFGERASRPQIR